MLAAGIDLLTHDWQTKRIDTPTYVEAAEPPARYLAKSGLAIDLHRLAVVLIIKASGFQDGGDVNQAVRTAAESMELLDAAVDQGDDDALVRLDYLTRVAPAACGYILDGMLKDDRLAALSPCVEPEVLSRIAAQQLRAERNAMSLRERLRWWVDDWIWDLRDWIDDRRWSLRTAWWRFTDRLVRHDDDTSGAE